MGSTPIAMKPLDFLVAEWGVSRGQAYVLCSLARDLRVTQLGKGIHRMLAKGLVR